MPRLTKINFQTRRPLTRRRRAPMDYASMSNRLHEMEDELNAAYAALARSEDRYSLVMTGPNEGIWEWDPNTKDLKLSARLLSILGFEGETLHTTSHEWLELVHPDDKAHYQEDLVRHLKGETPHFESQYRVRAHNGDYRWCLARGVAHRDKNNTPWRMVGSIGDITPLRTSMETLEAIQRDLENRVTARTRDLQQEVRDRTRAEDELRAAKDLAEVASRSKSEFLANMSHELRTPLNAILGFSEMIAAEMLGPVANQTYVTYASIINESGLHLLQVINDILDLSKIEAGKLDIHPEPMDIAVAAEGCRRLLSGRAEDAGLRFTLNIAPDLPLLLADPLRLKQVMLNLISNAIKFTPANGGITLVIRPDMADHIIITVNDTGIGMDADGIRKALEPFGQVDSRLARRFQGTGLGLPLSQKLVELQGGTLNIESTLGQGTRVTIRLPTARSAAAERADDA